MTEIILCGASGRMGKAVSSFAEANNCKIVAGVDIVSSEAPFPLYKHISEVNQTADVIVDFSHHSLITQLTKYASQASLPLVVATTGHTEEELLHMENHAMDFPLFFSRNMSLGIGLMVDLCRKASLFLGDNYDIEIIEKHHNKKIDAPSGTALMIGEALRDTKQGSFFTTDRTPVRRPRDKNEIGILSARGGGIVGDHEVLFCGANETLSISHSAYSRELFAEGALRAATFLKNKLKGFYSMKDLMEEFANNPQ